MTDTITEILNRGIYIDPSVIVLDAIRCAECGANVANLKAKLKNELKVTPDPKEAFDALGLRLCCRATLQTGTITSGLKSKFNPQAEAALPIEEHAHWKGHMRVTKSEFIVEEKEGSWINTKTGNIIEYPGAVGWLELSQGRLCASVKEGNLWSVIDIETNEVITTYKSNIPVAEWLEVQIPAGMKYIFAKYPQEDKKKQNVVLMPKLESQIETPKLRKRMDVAVEYSEEYLQIRKEQLLDQLRKEIAELKEQSNYTDLIDSHRESVARKLDVTIPKPKQDPAFAKFIGKTSRDKVIEEILTEMEKLY